MYLFFQRNITKICMPSMDALLKIKKNIHNKKMRTAIFIILSPIIFLLYIFNEMYKLAFGRHMVNKIKNKDEQETFVNEISICSIVKNEGLYIKEWIEYHLLIGIDKFYIYDNESSDDLKTILSNYIEEGVVDYTYISGTSKQIEAYNDCLYRHMFETKWLAFIDLDEFIQIIDKDRKIVDILNRASARKGGAGLGINWVHFGSSNLEKRPKGLVIESYLKRGNVECWQNCHIKTICNPRLVRKVISPHYCIYKPGAYCYDDSGNKLIGWYPLDLQTQNIRINHYFCKSREEALIKWNRGLADRNGKYDWKKFEQYDLNDIYDDSMLQYVEEVKKKMRL